MPLLRHVHEIVIIDFAFLIGRLVLNLSVIGCNHLKVYQADVYATQTLYDMSHLFACVIMTQKLFFARWFCLSSSRRRRSMLWLYFYQRDIFAREDLFHSPSRGCFYIFFLLRDTFWHCIQICSSLFSSSPIIYNSFSYFLRQNLSQTFTLCP